MSKIEEIINKEIGSTSEIVVLHYLVEKGIENVKNITEEDIETIEGNPIATKEYLQAIVKAAVQIAKECSADDIFRYIRCEASFNPYVACIELWKENMEDSSWEYLCEELDVDPDESECLYVKCVVEETDYEKY